MTFQLTTPHFTTPPFFTLNSKVLDLTTELTMNLYIQQISTLNSCRNSSQRCCLFFHRQLISIKLFKKDLQTAALVMNNSKSSSHLLCALTLSETPKTDMKESRPVIQGSFSENHIKKSL